ncbi:MAG TPA: hypothetical protein VLC06_04980 [Polyangia bacterium]|jgi:hypothetical protein|nr:hypothetical protein [Polyangia bacterium]
MAVLRSRARTLRTVVRFGLLVLLVLAVTPISACFNPAQPGCAFSCAGDGSCPSGYSCGNDLICHRDDGQGTCLIQTDAATDMAGIDAKTDTMSDATSGH